MNSIKGWIDLEINHDEQSAIDYFERAIAEGFVFHRLFSIF